jgi:hypothetical protein
MRRRSFALGLLAFSLGAAEARAATFDDATGTIRLARDAVFSQTFDTRAALASLPVRVLDVQRTQGYLLFKDTGAGLDDGSFVADAVEGAGALRVAGNRGVLLGDADSLAPLASGRVEVRMFARADGAMPELRVVYARRPLDDRTLSFPMAQVVALRTGRATSDGWIELSTGPIDGTLISAKIGGLLLVSPEDAPKGASFVVDALEVARVADAALSGGECTLATQAQACKAGASCVEGYCIDGAVVYGALPPKETRRDVVARTVTYLTRFEEDRHASANAASGFAQKMPQIAETADTPEAFYRPFYESFGEVRGAHTSVPTPAHYAQLASMSSMVLRYSGSELNACFGVVEKDLAGGGRGFGVYQVASPSPLQVGDVVDQVDGEPVGSWVARFAAEQELLAADPDSDAPYQASMLHAFVMRFGKTLTVQRCTAPGACRAVSIDLAALRKTPEGIKQMTCSPRFQLSVAPGPGQDVNAYEAAIMAQGADGIVSLHTNGEPLDDANWVSTVSSAFTTAQTALLVDKRRGDGGGGRALETWGKYMRRSSDVGLYFVGRLDASLIDGPPGFLDTLLGTCDGRSTAGACVHAGLETFPPAPGAMPAKVAWLTVLDGSASDMSTFFAKGATNVRIFAPNRTMGLFGGLGVMGGFLPGWSGGSVQFGDVREGRTNQERLRGWWHSGRGIDPDQVIVQRQSDLIANRDTMLEAARAWLLAQ